MFRGVVETALSSGQVALVEKALAELAIGHRQPFFVSDNPMMIEGLLERCHRLFPLSLTSFLQRQIIVENTECAIVVEIAQQIQCFEIVGAGFFRMVGADVKIAEIYQRVGDSLLIQLRALDGQHFFIAGFRAIGIARESADITKVAERIGEGAVILGHAIIRDGLLVCRSGLRQLATVEKNARAVFVVV